MKSGVGLIVMSLGEVDRTFKKVDEGVEAFNEIWEKVGDFTGESYFGVRGDVREMAVQRSSIAEPEGEIRGGLEEGDQEAAAYA